MALPLPQPRVDTLRFSFIQGTRTRVCYPRVANGSSLKLTLEPGEGSEAGAFYYRKKLAQGLLFTGADYAFLNGINHSADRCQPIGLLLETRATVYDTFEREELFTFTCNECKPWDPDKCTVTVTPTTDDDYRKLLEGYEVEYNILATPGLRYAVAAKLQTLAAGVSIEFLRIDKDSEGDYVGSDTEKWALFWRDNSDIINSRTLGIAHGATQSRNLVVFRYRRRAVPFVNIALPGQPANYVLPNLSASGYFPLQSTLNTGVTPHTIDYVKTPDIDNFRASTLTGFAGAAPFRDTKEYAYDARGATVSINYFTGQPFRAARIGGNVFLSVPCQDVPSQHGYDDGDYVRVTGPDGGYNPPIDTLGIGGANNAEFGGKCLNAREYLDDDDAEDFRSIYWRFGDFVFARGFKLVDAIYFLLGQVTSATGHAAILPPSAQQLSTFFTAATNPVTGLSGAANEIPRLLLSAASDVKRYGASEPADRLMVSLKQVLADLLALYDVGWFIDPATGWFRIEHRSYLDASRATGAVLDLTAIPGAQLPNSYGFRIQQLPRYDELVVASANTEDSVNSLYFDKASIDYGPGGCTNGREGQNKVTRTSARLTGDVTAMVLSGASIPDNALAVLAPDPDGRLTLANKQVAASELLRVYHGYGAATTGGTVFGQALNTHSIRPSIEQADQSVGLCTLRGIDGTTRLTTRLGSGGQVGKVEWDLTNKTATITPWLPLPSYTNAAPMLPERDFNETFQKNKFS